MSLEVWIEKRLGDFFLKTEFVCSDDLTALLGASGCGKSLTLRCIAGIVRPDRGRIVLNGRVLFDSEKKINVPPQKRKVGYLFQNYALFQNMTVEQNIACGIREKKTKVEKKEIIAEYVSEHKTGSSCFSMFAYKFLTSDENEPLFLSGYTPYSHSL